MTTNPTIAPTYHREENHDELNDSSGGLLIPLSLLFGSIFLTVSGLYCCSYKDIIYGKVNDPLLGEE